ncbi:malto-oligosyltrehalose synthase [Dietzia alimentaria]|uniref:malto-oligosyltrehalose synthase n=1 Tax=Dietzia alimentaria TaxID=665550 RepID=UPI00029A43D1|nr:malto-oligosyltrehalose synthase [Dietzia alimentaria]
MDRRATPSSTYRLQLRTPASDPDGRGFTLTDAQELLPYLAELGVGAVYLSPILTATPGSTHGYDVVDPTTVSAELGGIDGLRELRAACREHGLGLVVDIVPNHLGVEQPAANPWWWDALRRGPDSSYFSFFDFDTAPDNGVGGRIAIPVLGSPDDVADLVVVDTGAGTHELHFYEHRFPIAPGTEGGTAQQVHDRQHYRLVHWREPLLGYRRFFTVTELAGLRQEDPEVFEATHAQVRRWCEEDLVDGIRVDHPDGLADPVDYARRLRELAGPDRWLLVEKILAPGTRITPPEVLEPAMGVDGTTGYDMLRLIDQLLVDTRGEGRLSELAEQYCDGPGDDAQVHAQSAELKRQIVAEDLAPELARLVRAVRRDGGASNGAGSGVGGSGGERSPDDVGIDDDEALLREALISVIAQTPFYRADYPVLRGTLPAIVEELRRQRPELAVPLALVAGALARGGETSVRLAQVTGAATAKAEEDRLFYRLGRLVSLNEVGGSPGLMGLSTDAFHLAMAERARATPLAMSALSTHDTKRGEDVRARISVFSQVPDEWAEFVGEVFAKFPPPAADAGYFLLQVIVGVWPELGGPSKELRSRLHAYADKALREAAVHTTWTDQDAQFESAMHRWVDGLIDSGAGMVSSFVERIAPAGRDTALLAKALQLLAPGVPDVYQGTEVWEDSLVDPDNRRFVDYGPLRSGAVARAGHPKFLLVRQLLRVRREYPDALAGGAHVPIPVHGPAGSEVVSFTREVDGRPVVGMIARRRTAVMPPEDFVGTAVDLPPGSWAVSAIGSSGSGLGGGSGSGVRISGRVDVGELLADAALVVIERARG